MLNGYWWNTIRCNLTLMMRVRKQRDEWNWRQSHEKVSKQFHNQLRNEFQKNFFALRVHSCGFHGETIIYQAQGNCRRKQPAFCHCVGNILVYNFNCSWDTQLRNDKIKLWRISSTRIDKMLLCIVIVNESVLKPLQVQKKFPINHYLNFQPRLISFSSEFP